MRPGNTTQLLIGGLAVAAAAGVAIGWATTDGWVTPARFDGDTVVASAKYPTFTTLRQLVRGSDIVVRGTVERVGPARELVAARQPRTGVPEAKRNDTGILATDLTVAVESVIVGRRRLVDDRVRVVQLGGQRGGQRLVVEGEPPIRRRATYVLFLSRGQDGSYAIVGGLQGRYQVRGGRLTAASQEATTLPVVRELSGLSVETFEESFQALLRQRRAEAPPPERDVPLDDARAPDPSLKPPVTGGAPPPAP